MLAAIVLGLLILTAGFGIVSLLRWVRRRRPGSPFPTVLVALHVVAAVAIVTLWIAYLVTDNLPIAWITLGIVAVGNGLGDLVLAGRWRSTSAARGTLVKDYLAAFRDLSHPRRRINATHFALAGVTSLALAVTCLIDAFS